MHSRFYLGELNPISAQLRLLLTQLSFFGDADELSFQDRLAVAYKDFRVWRRENKVSCSHPLFTPNSVAWFQKVCLRAYFFSEWIVRLLGMSEVWKEKTIGGHLSCKAYNCRVLISWLSSCYSNVVSGACVPNRFVGQWLSDTQQEWPEHEMIAPTAEAMTLEMMDIHTCCYLFVETTSHIIQLNLDLLRNLLSTNMLLVESSPRYLCPGIGAAVST